MKKVLLSLMVAVLLLASVATFVTAAPGGVTNPDTLRQLAAAREATTKYHDVSLAVTDGYGQLSLLIPGMGYHYVNFALVLVEDFNVAAPAILLYTDAGSGRRLIGVEYAAFGSAPPEGFAGDEDEWEKHPASCHHEDGSEDVQPTPVGCVAPSVWHPDIWALHVWLWQGNPAGIFEAFNPNI